MCAWSWRHIRQVECDDRVPLIKMSQLMIGLWLSSRRTCRRPVSDNVLAVAIIVLALSPPVVSTTSHDRCLRPGSKNTSLINYSVPCTGLGAVQSLTHCVRACRKTAIETTNNRLGPRRDARRPVHQLLRWIKDELKVVVLRFKEANQTSSSLRRNTVTRLSNIAYVWAYVRQVTTLQQTRILMSDKYFLN